MPHESEEDETMEDWDLEEGRDEGEAEPQSNDNDQNDSDKGSSADDMSSFLGAYRQRYAVEDGPPLNSELARTVNEIWGQQRDPKKDKTIMEKYPRPENVDTHKVDVNVDVQAGLSNFAKSHDARLRSVQGLVAQGAVPAMKIAGGVLQNLMTKSQLVETALDCVTVLATANSQLNQLRRDLLKTGLQYRYQSICKMDNDDRSPWLFGENLSDKVKSAAAGGKVTKRAGLSGSSFRGRGRPNYHPYGYQGYGSYQGTYQSGPYQSYGCGYGQGYGAQGARGKPFLGRNNEISNNDFVDTHGNVMSELTNNEHETSSLSAYRPEGRLQETGSEEGLGLPERPEGQLPEVVGELPNIDVNKWGQQFEAGRVSQCVNNWARITSDPTILGQIRNFKLDFTEEPKQTRPLPELKFSESEEQFIQQEIQDLLIKKVIIKAKHQKGEFISNIFLREKKERGKYRMILNLKHLNKYVEKKHFKMESLISTLSLVTPGCTFMSFGCQDAYHSCSVFPPHRKYLRFNFQGQLYEFTALQNGLSSAPRFFTKIMKIALSYLREAGKVTISGYLDDNILVNYGDNTLAVRKGAFTAEVLQELGFTINVPKSVFTVVKIIEHLGFIINSETLLVTMTEDKVGKILGLVQKALHNSINTIRFIARIIGKMNATQPGNKYAALLTHNMEIDKIMALRNHCFDYDAHTTLSIGSMKDLNWIAKYLSSSSAPIRQPQPDYLIYTDASSKGWGCFDPQTKEKLGGRWGLEEEELHINMLELKAIWLSLQTITKQMTKIHLRIMTDSTTALACVNKQGSTRCTQRNIIARQIWDLAIDKTIWLSAAHIPGKLNQQADEASRNFNDRTEWTLQEEIFSSICKKFGKPSVDLFASRLNHKVQRYCSWEPDPQAIFIDSLMYDWGQEKLCYAFPPFSIIHKVVQKMIQDQAKLILIVPAWATQPWFTLLMHCTSEEVMTIEICNDEIFLPFRTPQGPTEHPLAGRLKLIAVRCSGQHWNGTD